MALFRRSKKVQCTESRPNEYYKHVYVEKRLYDGIEFLAKVNRTSRRQVCNDLLELGISEYLAREISRNNDIARAARKEKRALLRVFPMCRSVTAVLDSLSALPANYDAIWCQGSLINAPFDEWVCTPRVVSSVESQRLFVRPSPSGIVYVFEVKPKAVADRP